MVPNYTYEEIKRQPVTWQETIHVMLERKDEIKQKFAITQPDEVIFIGCGTSYYISIAAALTFEEQTGLPAKAVPASEIFLKPDAVIGKNKKTMIIASSRSGNTSEIVYAIEYVQKHNLGECISITSNPTSEMAKKSKYSIVLPHVQEESVVMTSSFTNLLLASQLIAGFVSNDDAYLAQLKELPERGKDILPRVEQLAKEVGENLHFNHFIYLGLGSYFGLACEGMLKMKEMTQLTSEAFNSLEFRHGPISVLNDRCLVVLLGNSSLRNYEKDVIVDVKNLQSNVVVVGDGVEDFEADEVLDLGGGLSDKSRGLLYLPFMQLMAYYRNLKLGLHPDKPRNLNQVVVLKS